MIVLDSSVLVGIVKGEADVTPLLDLLTQEDCAIGAPTLVEARIWCSMNLAARRSNWLEHLVRGLNCNSPPPRRLIAKRAWN